jgi:uncharacterized membrane protein YdjX (TVP38/TMEM64 family)
MSRLHPRIFLKGLLLIATLTGIAWLVDATPVGSMLDRTWVEHEVLGKGINGELLFLGAGALAVTVGMPRQAVSFLSGYAFGVGWGTVLGVLATTGGCLVNFYYARWIGRDLVTGRLRERLRRTEDFIHDNTFNMTLLIRLLPAGSNLLTNLAAGVSGVRALPFVLGSALGYIPQTLVFALVGSGVSIDPLYRIGLGVAIFLVSGLLGIRLYRRFRHGRHLDVQLEEKLGVDG